MASTLSGTDAYPIFLAGSNLFNIIMFEDQSIAIVVIFTLSINRVNTKRQVESRH